MTKRVFNLASIIIAFLLLLGFTSSSGKGKPLYLAYDSEDVIRDQSKVATITSTCGLIINGVEVLPQNMRSANTGFFKKQIVNADVFPGVHEVTVTHTPTGEDRRIRTNTTTDEKAGITTIIRTIVELSPITYNFKAGHVYVVEMHLFKIRIRELTKEKTIAKIAETRNKAEFQPAKIKRD